MRPVGLRDLVVQRAVVPLRRAVGGTGRLRAGGSSVTRRRTPGAAGRRTRRGPRRPGRCPRARGAPAWRGRCPSGRGFLPSSLRWRAASRLGLRAWRESPGLLGHVPPVLVGRARAAALATLRAARSLRDGFAAGAALAAVARPPASSVAAAARTRAWRRRRWVRFTWVPCLRGRSTGRAESDLMDGRQTDPGTLRARRASRPTVGHPAPGRPTAVYPTGRSAIIVIDS